MSINLLSEPIRKYIRDKRWTELRPVQNAAIEKIITTDNNYILASRTASGKTEAAFLPILSKVDFNGIGVQVLYVSPLIALINDQFFRINDLCKNLEISVTKWHGEASKGDKNKLLKNPNGIVLITPESLEAMFVNKPYNVKHLFSNLKFVVIDEIHSFIGTDRGIQLKSILSRIQHLSKTPFAYIGLSATIGDYEEVKNFTGNALKTKVLLDKTPKETNAFFHFFKSEKDELPLDLLKSLYAETANHKTLIFPNTRGKTEEVIFKLKKISNIVNGHANYFSHHSSVHREIREHIEFFAKNNNRQNFCISCTSTLELGIDIGSVDKVVQIDATNSISSLIQRIGRCGRNEGESSNLSLYATNKWSLLQSLACWLLYKEGFIEPPEINKNPYDILVHQTLSITKAYSGISLNELIKQLKSNFAFSEIDTAEIKEILEYLIKNELLEKLGNEIIIGIEGEAIINSRDFYSVFKTESVMKVIHKGYIIGELPLSPQISENENILLSAKIWKIVFVDFKANKIEVIPAKDGKKPSFFGGKSNVHFKVREKMLGIINSNQTFEIIDKSGQDEINIMRNEFAKFKIQNILIDRPLLQSEKLLTFFTFTGTRINETLQFLFEIANIKSKCSDLSSEIFIEMSLNEFLEKWSKLAEPIKEIELFIEKKINDFPSLIDFSKWGSHLPMKYKVKLIKDKFYDFKGAEVFISSIKPIFFGSFVK